MSSFMGGSWPMFGRALHNERNPFFGNATTDNPCVANH